MRLLGRFLWVLSAACVTAGFITRYSFRAGPLPQSRGEAWARFEAEAACYLLALAVFWVQLIVWGKYWAQGEPKSCAWAVAWFALSGILSLVLIWSALTDDLFP